MMHVKWDFENNKIMYGPQKITPKMGDGWFPYISHVEYPIYEGERIISQFVEGENVVIQKKMGAPTNVYQHQRRNEYPGIDKQLDALWHDINNNTLNSNGAFYTLLAEIKNKYPKEGV